MPRPLIVAQTESRDRASSNSGRPIQRGVSHRAATGDHGAPSGKLPDRLGTKDRACGTVEEEPSKKPSFLKSVSSLGLAISRRLSFDIQPVASTAEEPAPGFLGSIGKALSGRLSFVAPDAAENGDAVGEAEAAATRAAEEAEEEAAAIKMQAAARGMADRVQLMIKAEDEGLAAALAAEEAAVQAAATKMQAAARGRSARLEVTEEKQSRVAEGEAAEALASVATALEKAVAAEEAAAAKMAAAVVPGSYSIRTIRHDKCGVPADWYLCVTRGPGTRNEASSWVFVHAGETEDMAQPQEHAPNLGAAEASQLPTETPRRQPPSKAGSCAWYVTAGAEPGTLCIRTAVHEAGAMQPSFWGLAAWRAAWRQGSSNDASSWVAVHEGAQWPMDWRIVPGTSSSGTCRLLTSHHPEGEQPADWGLCAWCAGDTQRDEQSAWCAVHQDPAMQTYWVLDRLGDCPAELESIDATKPPEPQRAGFFAGILNLDSALQCCGGRRELRPDAAASFEADMTWKRGHLHATRA
jgi:hypothetical protein